LVKPPVEKGSRTASAGDSAKSPADDLQALILTSLDDSKAQDIISISLEGKSPMADFMVIASGTSSRQIAAMAEHLAAKLKQERGITVRVTGAAQGDWVLLDAGDAIVHLFRPEVRSFYNLEKMWSVEVSANRATGMG
jgi:ribosome-associated protein